MAARALPLEPGDIVLVSDKEFPANVYPWMRLGDRGVVMELVPTTAEGWPDEARLLERLRDPRVRVLAVSLVQFSSGYLVDLERLSAATRETGAYLVVDAIQGVGQLPVDVSRVEVDVLACGAQKWLLSPWGSGFVYVRRELIATLRPGHHRLARLRRHRRPEPAHQLRRHASGRCPAIRADDAPLPGLRRIQLLARSDPRARRGADPGSHPEPAPAGAGVGRTERRAGGIAARSPNGSGILCVSPEGVKDVHRRLKASRIVCSLREGAIRLSPHCYNTVEEMERVARCWNRGPQDEWLTTSPDMLAAGYGFTDPAITLGAALEGGAVHPEPKVRVPVAMMNRHGLVAGATGTGKTRTLQLLAEQLSAQGVPVFVADIKGDLSGLAVPGEARRPGHGARRRRGLDDWKAGGRAGRVREPHRGARRAAPRDGQLLRPAAPGQGALAQRDPDQRAHPGLQVRRRPAAAPARSVRPARGAPVPRPRTRGSRRWRATAGCPRRRWACCCGSWWSWRPRAPSGSSASPSSMSATCCRTTSDGRGRGDLPGAGRRAGQAGALLHLHDVAAGGALSATCPRRATSPSRSWCSSSTRRTCSSTTRPKAFLDQIQRVVRLIRSKGVGVYMVTQTPKDVPTEVLAQLGNRVQHALRAHTPNDDKALKATVRTYPKTDVLRPGGDAHLARHRRGGRHRSRPAGHADAGGRHASDPAALAHGAAHARGAAGRHPAVAADRGVRPGGGPGERARDAGATDGADGSPSGGAGAGAATEARQERREERGGKVAGAAVVGALSTSIGRTVGREIVRGLFGMLGVKPPRRTAQAQPVVSQLSSTSRT